MNSNERNVTINNDLFITEQLPDETWTWTLPLRLSNMLYLAEDLFGPRDRSYTPAGIGFVSGIPHVFFPGETKQNRKHITIRLGLEAATDTPQAYYQLAHETVHLLSPEGMRAKCGVTNNLEEGVATYYASYYMKMEMGQPNWHSTLPSYQKAFEKVAPLLDKDKYCIRDLRTVQPEFTKITEEQISNAFPDLSAKDIKYLLCDFKRDKV